MAAVVVQSRFAGLNIEDDDYPPSRDEQKKKKPIPVESANAAKKPDPAKKKTAAKSQNATQTKKKKSKSSGQTSQQWEQWKQKDEEMVDGNFENELHQAILLSKLDFEQNKDVYKQIKKDTEIEQKALELAAKNNGKKQKKKNVMSLDQFNDMVTGGEQNRLNHEPEKETEDQKQPSKDSEFFERIKHETKNELLKDKIIDRVKNRLVASDEVITRGQFADALEKKDIEIETLKQQVQSLKEELIAVKSRNKKLCNILGQGEMRDKAQVLVEVEKLRGVQAELTAEVQALHGQLERERSRNMDARSRDKKKKAVSVEKEK